MGYELREHLFGLWDTGDFTIKNSCGKPFAQVGYSVFSVRDKVAINYVQGGRSVRACIMQRKMLALRPSYQIFTYTPTSRNQQSTETDRGVGVYRFAKIT